MKHSTSRGTQRRRFLLPASLMLAALLVGISALKPDLFTSHAAEDSPYSLTVKADSGDLGGDFTITVNNDESLSTDFDEALGEDDKQVGETKTTYSIFIDGAADFTFYSDNPITSVSFGENTQFVSGINALNAGLTEVDVSGLSQLTSLYIPDISLADAYALSYDNEGDLTVNVKAPDFEMTEEGAVVTMPELDQNATVWFEGDLETPDTPIVPQTDGRYLLTFDDIYTHGSSSDGSTTPIYAKVTRNNITFRFILEINDEDIPPFTPSDPDEKDDPDDSDDPVGHISRFPAEKNSEDILISVGFQNDIVVKNGNQEVPLADVKAAAKAPSDKDKKAFLEAIKKADKDFAATDKNLMVYEVYLTDEKGNRLTIADGSVSSVLFKYAFPASELDYTDCTYKAYHQLADKTIESNGMLYQSAQGLSAFSETLGLFAIARTPIPIDYTDLTVREDSRDVIKSAQIDKTAVLTNPDVAIDLKNVCIAAVKPSDADRKSFLEAIQKTDKDFKADDKNLLVYDICLVNKDDGTEVYSSKFVKVTLQYPNDTVARSYDGYTYKVYHDKGDTVETRLTATATKDGITFSSKEFSLYAISATLKQSGGEDTGSPKTGDTSPQAVFAFVLAALSVISFAMVYTKNKAEQL